ncbi:hypothetical protein FJY63_02735, partial [Candidatus Sumerlaeota bacterium]|nr:hypothetical protein [Candidatus Sumerlaeota bacterium]
LPRYNAYLRPGLIRMPVGTRIVSHDFDMESDLTEEQKAIWKPQVTKEVSDKDGGSHTIYFWKITEEMKKASGVPLKGEPGAKGKGRKGGPKAKEGKK